MPPRPSFFARLWNALRNITTLISFFVNIILIVIVLVLVTQIGALKNTLNGILGGLDSAFEGLGKSTIVDTIPINEKIKVNFELPIDQSITVVTQSPVPIIAPANFSLGAFGNINGTVNLDLPNNTPLPVHLTLTVPVAIEIPVKFDQAVSINLYSKGLGAVVDKLRATLAPLIKMVKGLPDKILP